MVIMNENFPPVVPEFESLSSSRSNKAMPTRHIEGGNTECAVTTSLTQATSCTSSDAKQ